MKAQWEDGKATTRHLAGEAGYGRVVRGLNKVAAGRFLSNAADGDLRLWTKVGRQPH
jgi:hypothetical protein